MDTSATMDSLNDTPTLPELSFDDLLDVSPVKKSYGASGLDDPLELDHERKAREDETLNTPGPKKSRPQPSVTTTKQYENLIQITAKPTTAADSLTTATARSTGQITTTTTPLLLNSKHILSKTSGFSNQMVKISSKVLATTAAAATTSSPSPVTISGKTAVKTSNGQIIYIQKAAGGGQRLSATAAAATTSGLTATASGALTTTSIGNKTVAIQVIRAADGSIVPVKTTAAAASSASTNVVTTQLSGKQIIIKAPLKTSATTSVSAVETSSSASTAGATATTTTTFAKDALKMGMQFQKLSGVATVAAGTPTITTGGKIVVQSANGKQIVVSNQNLIKLSPKPPPTTAAAAAGQLQAIQIPGKGLQYVRVVPNSKITVSTAGTATIQTTSIANVASGISATTPPTTSTSTLKILNAMPQKFTVVRPNAVTKFMLTQSPKKEGSTATSISGGSVPVTFSPVTSKVQKTIVTVPTLRAIGDGNPTIAPSGSSGHTPSAQATLVKNFLSGTTPTNSGGFSLVRKHKISEINSEIQRITTMPTSGSETSVSGGGGGGQQTETKKTAGGQRIVVMSRSMLQPRQGTLQRVMAPGSAGSTNLNAVSSASTSAVPTNAMAPRKQFSVLKKPVENPYNNPAQAEMKSLIICGQAKALMAQQQQQHKTFMLKRQFNKVLTSTVAPASSFVAIQKPVAAAAAVAAAAIAPQPKPSFIKIERKPTVDDEYLDDEAFLRDIKPSLESLAEEAGATGAPRRKHCNCSKSQCLKLYCDCFANGEFCQDCTCKDCFNNLQYEDERQRAIKVCLERNPSAFKPKITTARDQGDMRLHNKGCNCKRSGCLKNYCECYEAKIPCSSNCKCVGCRNIEDRVDLDMDPIDPKIMATIANATAAYGSCGAQKRNYDRANSSGQNRSGSGASNSHNEKMLKEAAKSMAMHSNNNDLISAGGSSSTSSSVIGGGGINLGGSPPEKQQQCNFITQEVIDATIQCMISQADECEKNGLPAYQTEKMIMEELGRCLVEIIDFSIRNTDTSYTQE